MINIETLFDIYSQSDFNNKFEHLVIDVHKQGHIYIPIYLSIGTEHIPACIKEVFKQKNIKKYSIFSQHRNHSYYNTFLNKPKGVLLELCGFKNGINKGMGGSTSIADISGNIKVYGHDGLLGSQCPLGVGYAFASKEPTVIVIGDGAAEEDYVLGSLGFASTHQTDTLFIVEDNNLSILTPKKVRRTWDICNVARGFGIESYNIDDKPETIYDFVSSFKHKPLLLNINCCRHYWHANIGKDQEPEYNRVEELKTESLRLNKNKTEWIEKHNQERIKEIWDKTQLEM